MQRAARMKREMTLFEQNPPHGITCFMKDDKLYHLEAQLIGPDNTPYAGGIFKLDIEIPDRYPFEPPKMRFVTPVYHPNIDTAGRICLDSLKMPPKGAWKPALNVSTLLTTLQLLLSEPNPDDPLMAEIAEEFRYNKSSFEHKAKEWTVKYATGNSTNTLESEEKQTENSGSSNNSLKRNKTDEDDVSPLQEHKMAKNR